MTFSWATSTIDTSGVVAVDWHGAITCDVCSQGGSTRAAAQLIAERASADSSILVAGSSRATGEALARRFVGVVVEPPSGTVDVVLSTDSVGTSSNWRDELRRSRDVLGADGRLVMTARFDPSLPTSSATATSGQPGPGRIFGWDLLGELIACGFNDAVAHHYWAPWHGHLGETSFVFEATT